MRKALIILLIGLNNFAFAQERIDTSSFLPAIDSIKQCVKLYYDEKIESESYEYKYSIRYKWLKYIPTFGINLAPLSPIIGFNTSQVVNQANLSAQKKAKLMTIERTNALQYEQDLIALQFNISSLQNKIVYYHFLLDNLELHKQRFSIIKTSYENQQITPSEFLDKQIQFNTVLSTIKMVELDILTERNNILLKFRYCK